MVRRRNWWWQSQSLGPSFVPLSLSVCFLEVGGWGRVTRHSKHKYRTPSEISISDEQIMF